MELVWMGRCRSLMERIIRFGNLYAGTYKMTSLIGGIELSATELQVLESLLENEELQQNMASAARRLGIPSSSFTKMVARLTERGLLEKYHPAQNKKEVVVLVNDFGKQVYSAYLDSDYTSWMPEVNRLLEDIPEKQIRAFEQILDICGETADSKRIGGPEAVKKALVPIQPKAK